MGFLTRSGRPALLGGLLVAIMYSSLSLSDAGGVSAIDFVENHGLFHIIQAPVFALLIVALLQARATIGQRMTRLARFGSSLAIFGFAVGVVAGAIVPILEFVFNVNTDSGTIDAVVHMPEFLPFVVGTFLFGVAIAVSRLLPRQYGVLLAAGAVIMLVFGASGAESMLGIIGASAFGIGWASLGVALIDPPTHTSRPVAQLEPAS